MSRQPTQWADQPQEIPDAEHEQLVAWVCAIDVGETGGQGMYPGASSRADTPAGMQGVGRGGHHQRGQPPGRTAPRSGVQKVTVESTADYWRI
jgi:transposase